MNDNKILVLDLDRAMLVHGFFAVSFMVGLIVWILYNDDIVYHLFGYYIYFVFRSLLIIFAALMTTAIPFTLLLFFDKKPVAIIDEKGIWFKDYGFVMWSDIEHIDIYAVGNTPMEVIGIRLKNVNKISKQSSWAGKCRLFWAKLFNHKGHIDLSNLNIPHETIVDFTKQFMPGNQKEAL